MSWSFKKEEQEIIDNFDKLFKYIEDIPENKLNIFDSQIFDQEYSQITEIVEEIKCPICLHISENSIQCTKCCKLYCKKCIKEIKKLANKCPTCQIEISLKETDILLKNIIGKLPIICPNCKKYGKKSNRIKLEELKSHIKNCNYSNYECLICSLKIGNHSKKECYKHAINCGYLDVVCDYCNKKFKKFKLLEHKEKCGEEKVDCELCKSQLKKKEIKDHKKNCIYREVECPKCQEKYLFKDKHLETNCLNNQIKYLKKQNEAIIKQNEDILKENEYIKKQNEDIKQEKEIIQQNNKTIIEILKEDFSVKDIDNYLTDRGKKKLIRQNTEPDLFKRIKDLVPINNEKSEKEIINIFSDSSILSEKNAPFINSLFNNKKNIKFTLAYKMTKDLDNFHKKCDNIGPTLSLFQIKIQKNLKYLKWCFGGYTSINWDCSNSFKKDDKAFIFSITKEKLFRVKDPSHSIACCSSYGPSFGLDKKSKAPSLFCAGKEGHYSSTDTFGDVNLICTNGEKEFEILELEVYKVISI